MDSTPEKADEQKKPKTQWHPLFAKLLKPVIGKNYEIETEVSVSDFPRRGDFLIVRREGGSPRHDGVWDNLTEYNVIDFKGMTDAPTEDDFDHFGAIGLGLSVKINDERRKEIPPKARIEETQFSNWFIVKDFGAVFMDRMYKRCPDLCYIEGEGIWKAKLLNHPLFFTSARSLLGHQPDSLPLKAMDRENPLHPTLTKLVGEDPELFKAYAETLALLHPKSWKEILLMPNIKEIEVDWAAVAEATDIRGAVRALPAADIIETLGADKAIEAIGTKKIVEAVGTDKFVETLGTKKLVEAVGTDKFVETVGMEKLVEAVGTENLVEAVGTVKLIAAIGKDKIVEAIGDEELLSQLLARLTPQRRAELLAELKPKSDV